MVNCFFHVHIFFLLSLFFSHTVPGEASQQECEHDSAGTPPSPGGHLGRSMQPPDPLFLRSLVLPFVVVNSCESPGPASTSPGGTLQEAPGLSLSEVLPPAQGALSSWGWGQCHLLPAGKSPLHRPFSDRFFFLWIGALVILLLTIGCYTSGKHPWSLPPVSVSFLLHVAVPALEPNCRGLQNLSRCLSTSLQGFL